MSAFDQGWCAAQAGAHLWDNPFNRKWSPTSYDAWNCGWWDWANDESDDK